MFPRKPLPHAEQLVRLKRYLRRSRTELRHRYDELFEATKGRRECPLEVSIRRRMVAHFRDTVSLLEACLGEMERQEAMFYAPFKPGDRISVARATGGMSETRGPFLIIDVLPDKQTRYSYECAALTKSGAMHKRLSYARIQPDASSTVQLIDAHLNEAGEWEAEYYRRCAETSRQLAFYLGDTTLFEGRSDMFDRVHHRRKDRLDP